MCVCVSTCACKCDLIDYFPNYTLKKGEGSSKDLDRNEGRGLEEGLDQLWVSCTCWRLR